MASEKSLRNTHYERFKMSVIHEDFIGIHPLERTNADQVVAILKNALLRINFNTQRARGQCYDGAASKADEKTGVRKWKMLVHALLWTCLKSGCR